MPAYFSIYIEMNHSLLDYTTVDELHFYMKHAGLTFKNGCQWAEGLTEKEIIEHNQKLLLENFVPDTDQSPEGGYAQSEFEAEGFSGVRGFFLNRFPEDKEFVYELVIPEEEVFGAEKNTIKKEAAERIKHLLEWIWHMPTLKSLQTSGETGSCVSEMSFGKDSLPSAMPYAFVSEEQFSRLDQEGFEAEHLPTSGVLLTNKKFKLVQEEKTMNKAMTISYEVGNNLYLNFTNKCPCACTFCIRNNADGAYGSDPLWLEHEPSMDEIKADLDKRDIAGYDEIVFCGYGEPTERLETVIEAAEYLRKKDCKKLRINTNGLGDLVNGRSIAGELCEAVDVVSVSLNAGTEDEYMKVTRPRFDNAFAAMQNFTADCVKTGKAEVVMSVVDVIPQEQIEASKKVAESLGAVLRVRKYDS